MKILVLNGSPKVKLERSVISAEDYIRRIVAGA